MLDKKNVGKRQSRDQNTYVQCTYDVILYFDWYNEKQFLLRKTFLPPYFVDKTRNYILTKVVQILAGYLLDKFSSQSRI